MSCVFGFVNGYVIFSYVPYPPSSNLHITCIHLIGSCVCRLHVYMLFLFLYEIYDMYSCILLLWHRLRFAVLHSPPLIQIVFWNARMLIRRWFFFPFNFFIPQDSCPTLYRGSRWIICNSLPHVICEWGLSRNFSRMCELTFLGNYKISFFIFKWSTQRIKWSNVVVNYYLPINITACAVSLSLLKVADLLCWICI